MAEFAQAARVSILYTRFIEFASIHVLASSPFRRGNVPEPCPHQHHRGIAIRETADYPRPAANFLHDPFQTVIGPKTAPMLVREVHVGQGLFHAVLHELRHLFQFQFAEFGRHQCRFLARGLFIFLRVDRLQHCGDLSDMFPRALRESIAIPVNHAALPFRLREEVAEDFIQPAALVRNDQPHPF